MIRTLIVILIAAAVAIGAVVLAGDPGRASVVWLGWRVDMTAAAALLIVLFYALLATAAWRTLLWILAAPQRSAQARAENRRRQGNEALTRGFLAAAAGDGSEARRLARKAADLAIETPGLVRVLAAQAAEAAGDTDDAKAAYTAMLGDPEMRLAGHRGLMQIAQKAGEQETALRHAQEAFAEARGARWAWRVLLDAKLDAADWNAGLDLVKAAEARKIVPPVMADRARAALLAALAAQLDEGPEPKGRHQPLDRAVEAAKLQPGFAPGVVMAARLLAADGKQGRAAQTLETAWKAAPHPALWLAYRDLNTTETPAQRAKRLGGLAGQNPTHRESLILHVERALIINDAAGAQEAITALNAEPVTARIAGLQARVAYAAGRPDEARLWLAKGASAPHEADWSDLDPEGRAFAYEASDWARLVRTFADTGELIHPRLERREKVMGELPDLPIAYADAAPFLNPDGSATLLYPVEEAYGDDDPPSPTTPPETPAPENPPKPPRAPASRRRLASAPRAAK